MATRSTIGYRTPDGRIVAVYCHWDGYPEHNGRILQEHYSDTLRVAKLCSGGSISSLKPDTGVKHDFSRLDSSLPDDEYEAKYGEMTTYYARDRGEQLVINIYNDAKAFVEAGEEYNYFWNGTAWLVNDHGQVDANDFPVFDLLESVLLSTVEE